MDKASSLGLVIVVCALIFAIYMSGAAPSVYVSYLPCVRLSVGLWQLPEAVCMQSQSKRFICSFYALLHIEGWTPATTELPAHSVQGASRHPPFLSCTSMIFYVLYSA